MYLVDTCALLWFLDDNPRLSLKARDVIGKSNDLYVSIASLWEIAIKRQLANWI
ncbi:MAG: twitching motility protein PilT [Lachnospiraceae bacterium]|nr:twitching motility protein PilT [Lachnospiraceae bacterium]